MAIVPLGPGEVVNGGNTKIKNAPNGYTILLYGIDAEAIVASSFRMFLVGADSNEEMELEVSGIFGSGHGCWGQKVYRARHLGL